MPTNLIVGLLLLGALLAVMVIRARTQGMNVPRDTRPRTDDVLHYEDLTPEERRANGFIPTNELSPDWQKFMKRKP